MKHTDKKMKTAALACYMLLLLAAALQGADAGLYLQKTAQALIDSRMINAEAPALALVRQLTAHLSGTADTEKLLLVSAGDAVFFAAFNTAGKIICLEKVGFRYKTKLETVSLFAPGTEEIVLTGGYHPGTGMLTEFAAIYKWRDERLDKVWSAVITENNGPYAAGTIAEQLQARYVFQDNDHDGIREPVLYKTVKKVRLNGKLQMETLETETAEPEIYTWQPLLFQYTISKEE